MTVSTITRSLTRSIRIVALPLTSHCKPASGHKAVEHLTYYHFITPPDDKNADSWSKKAVAKASDLWAGLGKAAEGTWKRRAFVYGERLVDRLDFEELALKSLDPSLGPRLSNIVPHGSKQETVPVIPLIYPPSACASPMPHLRSLLEKRTPRHKKGFWFWLVVSPLTAPFMLIPIIPNLPFFFCVWRSWSHYRAYKASQYLEGFLQQGAIVPEGSAQLDAVYAKYASPHAPAPQSDKSPPPSDHASTSASSEEPQDQDQDAPPSARVLLTSEAVDELQKALGLPEKSTLAADVLRALEQARLRLDGTRK